MRWSAGVASLADGPAPPASEIPWGASDPSLPCDRSRMVRTFWCAACNLVHAMPQACTRCDCARCAGHIRRRRGQRLQNRLGRFGVAVWVVTFPAAWRKFLTIEVLRELQRRIVRLVQEHYQDTEGVRIGLRSYLHPRGDRCHACQAPDGGWERGVCVHCQEPPSWEPHFNLIVPLAGLTPAGCVRDLRHWQPVEALSAFRARLHALLVETASELGISGLIAPNFYYEYAVERKKLDHALAYFARPFPEWAGLMGAFGHGQDYGLLAGRDSSGGRDFWRSMIRWPEPEEKRKDSVCSRCGGVLRITGIMSIESREYAEILRRQGELPYLRVPDSD